MPIRRLLNVLPKFSYNTTVPYDKKDIPKLHKENINYVTNYLQRFNLAVPDCLSLQALYKNKFNLLLKNNNCITLSHDHPFSRLKRILKVFKLVMLPADKTKTLVILPETTINKELNIHLSDKLTYELISVEKYIEYNNIQLQCIRDAILFYKKSKLMPTNPSTRYIYFLPKIHKELTQWRTPLHPKMRPIISDTNSLTYYLAKHLLPVLQEFEKNFTTTVTSSLGSVYNIYNATTPTEKTNLATIDVESLFTNIPKIG